MAAPKRSRIRKRKASDPRGLDATQTLGTPPPEVTSLVNHINHDGGMTLASYREPFGGSWVVLAALPLDKVEPASYQRDISKPHVARLANVIEKLDRFLDPVIAVRVEGRFLVPNGNHRCQALRALGAKTVIALVVPDAEVAYKILALNTEKAHGLREKSLEVARMERVMLAAGDRRRETDLTLEFEEPGYLTLGFAYESRPKLAGSAYFPVLRRTDEFLDEPLGKALAEREDRAKELLSLSDAVESVVKRLRERGFESPYLRSFVVARINPLRFQKREHAPFFETIGKMRATAQNLNIDRLRPEELSRAAGPPEEV